MKWTEQNIPRQARAREGPEMRAFDMAWQKTQYDGGWAGISWPAEYGGRGLATVLADRTAQQEDRRR